MWKPCLMKYTVKPMTKRLDGLIQKIETAMEKIVIRITSQLKQPEKKRAVVEEIKKEVKPSIREKEARTYFDQLWVEAMEIYWSVEDKNSLLRFSKEMGQKINKYRKQFTQEDTMAGMIQGWLDAYKGTHVCSVLLSVE